MSRTSWSIFRRASSVTRRRHSNARCTSLSPARQARAVPRPARSGWLSFDGSGHYEGEYIEDGRQNIPVYNMIPEHGYPAEFGFIFAELAADDVRQRRRQRRSTQHVACEHPRRPGVSGARQLSGRGGDVLRRPGGAGRVPGTPVAFFTNPSECSGEPLVTSIHVDSWQNPGARNPDGTPDFSDPAWKSDTTSTPAVEGCEALQFNPTISLTPDVAQAGAPTGLGVNLEVPQSSDPSIPATPDVEAGRGDAAGGHGRLAVGGERPRKRARPRRSPLKTTTRRRARKPRKSRRSKSRRRCWQKNWKARCIWRSRATPARRRGRTRSARCWRSISSSKARASSSSSRARSKRTRATGQLTATFAESPQLPFSDFKLHFTERSRARRCPTRPRAGPIPPKRRCRPGAGRRCSRTGPLRSLRARTARRVPGACSRRRSRRARPTTRRARSARSR